MFVRGTSTDYDADRFSQLVLWLESPLALRLAEAEVAASTPEAMQEMAAFSMQLGTNRPPLERIELIQRLDAAVGMSEMAVANMVLTARVMIVAMASVNPEDAPAEAELDSAMAGMAAGVRPAIANSMMAGMLFIYKDEPDEALSDYVSFYESEAGQWAAALFNRALLAGFEAAGYRLGEVLRVAAETKSEVAE